MILKRKNYYTLFLDFPENLNEEIFVETCKKMAKFLTVNSDIEQMKIKSYCVNTFLRY